MKAKKAARKAQKAPKDRKALKAKRIKTSEKAEPAPKAKAPKQAKPAAAKAAGLNAQVDQWLNACVHPALAKFPERQPEFASTSGTPIRRLYTPCDTESVDYARDIGFPGQHPFTRGVQPTMYRGRLWTMRQYAGFGDAAESNKRYQYLLTHGQTGLSIAFDLPTQIGYDSDHPMAAGEVGKVGVAIDSMADMEVLFDGIPMDKVSTSMTINAPAAVLLAMYIAVAEKQGVKPEALNGTIQNDILKEYIARGTYIFPPKPSMRLITDIFAYCAKNVPKWNTISISGYHIREAGSSAVQEVAFTLADGVAYVQAAIDSGMNVDDFASRLSFFFNAHNDLLEEVAKFRAARRIWARIMKDRFKAQKPSSQMLRFHTQTGGSTLTAQQPDNNIVRVTIQTLAAVLGGTQSLHTNSRDEALALPTEDSVRIALRTQQIVAHESGCADTVDPLAGSYYVEARTSEIEQAALEYIAKIDKLGGMVKAIEKGFVQKEIQDSAYRYQKQVEAGERIVVGVNKFMVKEEAPKNLLKVSQAVQEAQIRRLDDLRRTRSNDGVKTALEEIRKAAKGTDNLMPHILGAVRQYATLGEVCGVLREVFGEYQESVVL
jgi:methylmalonyl-CoA mutase N-terminal domain/subunit